MKKLILTIAIVGVTACPLGGVAQAAPFAYVVTGRSHDVWQYAIGVGGELSPLSPPTVAAGAGPEGAAANPDGKSLYVVNIAGNSVSQYSIDPVSGRLSPKSPAMVAAGGGPRDIAVTPDGKSAYVTNGFTDQDTVSQYDIDPVSGALSPNNPPTIPAGREPLGVAVTPDGRSAYVSNQFGANVSQYSIDPATGALSPKNPATVPAGTGPIGVAVTPDGRSAYVTNSSGLGISQYDIDPVRGALSPKSSAMVDAGLGPGAVAVTPDGRSAYVTNLNSGFGTNLSQYDIDPGSGALSPKTPAMVDTGVGPSAVAVTPDGKSVYVANFNSDNVSQFNVGPGGALTPKSPVAVAAVSGPTAVVVASSRVPTSKAQCKNGGWRNFPQFKNQGQCIAFVNHGP
jgi:DNA-binding beta-propeller fold protein YncE